MTNQQFYLLLNELDDQLLTAAEAVPDTKPNRRTLLRLISVAACAVLLIGAVVLALPYIQSMIGEPPIQQPGDEDSTPPTENTPPEKVKIDLAPYEALLNGDIQATSIGTATVADGATGGELQIDVQWNWGASFSDDTAPQELEVVFNGQTYHGTYDHSYIVAGTDCIEHVYTFTYMVTQDFVMSDGSISEFTDPYDGKFYIDASTGELIGIDFTKIFDGNVTLKEAEIIAEQAAASFTDLSEYRRLDSDIAGRMYIFRYEKRYQRLPTREDITVIVDRGGNILSVAGGMYGMFPYDQKAADVSPDVAKLTSADARKVVEAKAICAGKGYYDRATVSETPFWGMIDGELQLIYTAQLSSSTDEHMHSHALLYIIVKAAENTDTQTK